MSMNLPKKSEKTRVFGKKQKIKNIFQKPLDKPPQLWYNHQRYPKTAGSGKSVSFPAEVRRSTNIFCIFVLSR